MDNNLEVIIIVDDDITNLTIARNNLAERYNTFTAPSGEKLFLLLEKVSPALILLDVEMPEMNGYMVMEKLKEKEKTAHIPVIFLTAKVDPENELEGLNKGAVDYITKPFSRELLIKRIDLHILLEKQRKELLKHNLSLEGEVDKKTRTVLELQNTILKTIAELVECRDNVTGGHIERTQHYLSLLINFLLEHNVYTEELSSWDIDLLVMSSQLHDVGKIYIKDEILMKPDKLTNEEFDEMKKHAIYGVEIIRKIEESTTENEFLKYAEILAGSHHEKWNGRGYPYGLKGDEIPLHGRLMAIVDVYDALTNDRPYKKAFSHEEAMEIIIKEKGEHFDPSIVDVLQIHEKEFKLNEIRNKNFADPNNKLHPAIKIIVDVIGTRSSKEYGHTERIRQYLEILVNALLSHENYKKEISSWDTDLFLLSAQLRNIGGTVIADHILKSLDDKHDEVKIRTKFEAGIIQQMNENIEKEGLLYHVKTLVGCQNEKWDGTGYPQGLKGKEIPLQGRIMAIVDAYNALTTDRPHRKKKTHKEAVEIIMNGSNAQFDPELVDVFLEHEKEFEKMETQVTAN